MNFLIRPAGLNDKNTVHQKFIAGRKTRAPLHIFNIDDAKRVTTYKLADDTNVFRQDSDENAPTNQQPG